MHVISEAQEQHRNVELHVNNFRVVVVVVVVVLVDFNFVASLFPMLGKNDFATDERSAVSVCQ